MNQDQEKMEVDDSPPDLTKRDIALERRTRFLKEVRDIMTATLDNAPDAHKDMYLEMFERVFYLYKQKNPPKTTEECMDLLLTYFKEKYKEDIEFQ
uniref:Vacuolar protein sorting-associated protein 28 homolog n=1 Tax=Caenorhabditis tropicalis TaxID=1561998 RepID=A0A1I7T8W7_9PELO